MMAWFIDIYMDLIWSVLIKHDIIFFQLIFLSFKCVCLFNKIVVELLSMISTPSLLIYIFIHTQGSAYVTLTAHDATYAYLIMLYIQRYRMRQMNNKLYCWKHYRNMQSQKNDIEATNIVIFKNIYQSETQNSFRPHSLGTSRFVESEKEWVVRF